MLVYRLSTGSDRIYINVNPRVEKDQENFEELELYTQDKKLSSIVYSSQYKNDPNVKTYFKKTKTKQSKTKQDKTRSCMGQGPRIRGDVYMRVCEKTEIYCVAPPRLLTSR